jgi:hypothetical protein
VPARPGLDDMLNDAQRRRFDVVIAWAIDRLGRSLIDLLSTIQALEAPFKHPRLKAVTLAGDPNNPIRFKDDTTIEELRAEVLKHLEILAPVLDLPATLVQEVRQVQENKGLLPAEQGDAE